MSETIQTRGSLLHRLKGEPNDRDWETFFKQYSGIITRFCQHLGLDDASARDVLQETMLLLMRKLPDFTYDPERGRFRSWLFKLVVGKAKDAMRRASRFPQVQADVDSDKDCCADYIAAEAESMKRAWMMGIVDDALRRIQQNSKSTEKTFMVFRAYVIEGRPADEVASQFGMEVNAVYQVKNNLVEKLRKEIAAMEK